ncbi:hypothetical protein [Nocardioides sp. GY 10127]|uniref:hypothetical protein n=1 Tax=Nocardioides sp. GY 10127 TaxID=2569762 RepID=UPI0010A88693|nr:hypothetical protein [Nocardioides sp. GY 10127]TIC86390.1 hypothetical protein E8D37_00285 [Nocardioides sp. GY 10127]
MTEHEQVYEKSAALQRTYAHLRDGLENGYAPGQLRAYAQVVARQALELADLLEAAGREAGILLSAATGESEACGESFGRPLVIGDTVPAEWLDQD